MTCTSPVGFVAVKLACLKDGGERIFKTANSNGYAVDNQSSDCLGCLLDVGTKRFAFVDHNIPNTYNTLTDTLGFNRYTVRPIEDRACDAWRDSPGFRERVGRIGLAEDECIALMPIETPVKYRFSNDLYRIWGPFATRLSVFELKIAAARRTTASRGRRNDCRRNMLLVFSHRGL